MLSVFFIMNIQCPFSSSWPFFILLWAERFVHLRFNTMIKSDKVRLFILLSYLFIFSWFSYHSIREYINAVSFDWSFTFSSHSLIHGFILLFMYRNILLSQGGGPVHLFEITKWPVLSQYLILHACHLSFKIPPFYLLWCFLLYESCFFMPRFHS